MKLKPIHYILIIILIVEIAICAWVLLRPTNSGLPNDTQLDITYENVDNVYAISSIFNDAEITPFSFECDGQDFVFDGNVVDMVEMYKNKEAFAQYYQNATADAWVAYQTATSEYIEKQMETQHASLNYIQSIATQWYNVEPQTTLNNNGLYTIQAYSTLNEWVPLFSEYQINGYDKILDEMALAAIVQIGEQQHHALVYMRVLADNDPQNNETAPEVSITVLFGDAIMNDFDNAETTIYFLRPDGSEYFAHSKLSLTFHANTTESYYRTLSNIVGG